MIAFDVGLRAVTEGRAKMCIAKQQPTGLQFQWTPVQGKCPSWCVGHPLDKEERVL